MDKWLLVGHLIGVILWIAGLTTVYWLLRLHTHAPKEVHDRLTLMERSLALMMDLAATLAMGCGIALTFFPRESPNLFARPGSGWFHIKLTLVVLGIISTHGLIRARVAKFSRGQVPNVPQWIWSLMLIAIVGILVMVFRGPIMFAPKP